MFEAISSFLHFRSSRSISKNYALLLCIGITAATMGLEFYYGKIAHSLMLISDGFHMMTHALSLGLTLVSRIIAHAMNNRRVEVVAITINGISLLYFGLYISYEAVMRMLSPEPIDITYTFVIALVGFAVNIGTALILNQAGIEDLNTKSAFAHMIADTLSSVSILIGSAVIHFTGWYIIDGILSMIVAILVVKWAIDLLRSLIREYSLQGKRSYL